MSSAVYCLNSYTDISLLLFRAAPTVLRIIGFNDQTQIDGSYGYALNSKSRQTNGKLYLFVVCFANCDSNRPKNNRLK